MSVVSAGHQYKEPMHTTSKVSTRRNQNSGSIMMMESRQTSNGVPP
jgi:hypothetical protein